MNAPTLSFDCEDYLREWFIFDCGGDHPVKLRKNSPESNLLEFALRPKKDNIVFECKSENPLIVYIPSFRFKNPEFYNSITATGRIAFIEVLRKRFDLQLWNDLCSLVEFCDRKDNLVYSWMESHGIENTEKNFNTVIQRLNRMRTRFLSAKRMRKYRQNKKNEIKD